MTGVLAAVLCALVSAPSPATTAKPAKATATKGDVDEARRLYSIGEAEIAKGRASRAVSLWRRAIVLLPTTAEYDKLRHKLVLRLGYGMLVATKETGERRFAIDGAHLLDRYLVQHEQLFGDGPEAERERGEVYELLYELETRIEETPEPSPPNGEDNPARVDPGAPEIGERTVVVPSKRKRARTTVDDPQTRDKLKSSFTSPFVGLVLTAPTAQVVHPARGLVRVIGIARPVGMLLDGRERRAVHDITVAAVSSVRPALRSCFDAAFARTPTAFVETQAELLIEPDGSVSSAEIVGAPVVDATGSRCAARKLADAVASNPSEQQMRVRVGLLFFWEDARYIDEGSGAQGAAAIHFFMVRRTPNHGSEGNMPPIETGAAIPSRAR